MKFNILSCQVFFLLLSVVEGKRLVKYQFAVISTW